MSAPLGPTYQPRYSERVPGVTQPPPRSQALGYWGAIEHAVASRASTADLWAAIRGVTADPSNKLTGISFREVNQLRSAAAGIRNAGQRLNAAEPDQVLRGNMLHTAPWARSEDQRELTPKLQVRFEHTVLNQGVPETEWRTYLHPGPAPQTVGDLRDLVDRAGRELARDYEVEHFGVGSISAMIV